MAMAWNILYYFFKFLAFILFNWITWVTVIALEIIIMLNKSKNSKK